MKKTLCIIILILSGVATGHAQNTFAPVGSEWWYYSFFYDYNGFPSSSTGSTFHTWSQKDTTIDGISCRKVITEINTVSNG